MAGGNCVKIDRAGEGSGLPEHHIGRTRARRAYDHVIDAVIVDVACSRYRQACEIARVLALDLKSSSPRGEGVETHRVGKPAGPPKNDIGCAGFGAPPAVLSTSEKQIVDAVPVDIARR